MIPIWLIGGGLLLVGLAVSSQPKGQAFGRPIPNQWGLLGCDRVHAVSANGAAVPGVQTAPDYQWCYVVNGAGDSAGAIAERVLGAQQAWRYVELLSANPSKEVAGKLEGAGTASELNFKSLSVGETLFLPRTWNPWIDQLGTPRGQLTPFPGV